MGQRSLSSRVTAVASGILQREGFVTVPDLFIGLGWLASAHVDSWRQGRLPSLETMVPVDSARVSDALDLFRRWAEGNGLTAEEVWQMSSARDHRRLQYSQAGDPAVEQAWATSWLAPDLPPKVRARVDRKSQTPDLVVVMPVNDWTCAECRQTGDLLIMDAAGPLCMTCADMDHLVYLPAGEAALTRRAKKASRLSAVVVRWSRTRKRYERQGLLVEEAALDHAEQQCLADEDARTRRRERDRERRAGQDVEFQRRFAQEIRRLYPRCPAERADAIATHAAQRGSGRVGRSAAARELDRTALTLAVVASIRHLDTDYDELLMSGMPRAAAREKISGTIDRVLAAWS